MAGVFPELAAGWARRVHTLCGAAINGYWVMLIAFARLPELQSIKQQWTGTVRDL